MTVFVCGLSKSGKSTLIRDALVPRATFHHVKVSSLLRAAGRPVDSVEPKDFLENQFAFARAAVRTIADSPEPIILDGHLVVETTGGPQLVPDVCIDALPLSKLILVEDEPTNIASRRYGTGLSANPVEVKDLMALERFAAVRLARRRSIALSILKSGDSEGFVIELAATREALASSDH